MNLSVTYLKPTTPQPIRIMRGTEEVAALSVVGAKLLAVMLLSAYSNDPRAALKAVETLKIGERWTVGVE